MVFVRVVILSEKVNTTVILYRYLPVLLIMINENGKQGAISAIWSGLSNCPSSSDHGVPLQ